MSDPADLSNLRDIALPPDVALWPPAPGWWIIGAAVVASGAVLAAMAVARHRRNAYRRAALVELDQVPADGLSAVLKRAALVAWPRREVASLTGDAWLAFLTRTGKGAAFPPGRPIESAAARTWVRRHRC